MENPKKIRRYTIVTQSYIYVDDNDKSDKLAIKKAKKIVKKMNEKNIDSQSKISSIFETPFASLNNRKIHF